MARAYGMEVLLHFSALYHSLDRMRNSSHIGASSRRGVSAIVFQHIGHLGSAERGEHPTFSGSGIMLGDEMQCGDLDERVADFCSCVAGVAS